MPEAPLDGASGTNFLTVRCGETLPLLDLVLFRGAPIFEGFSGLPWLFAWVFSFHLLQYPSAQVKRQMLVEDSTWRESSGKGGWNWAVRGVVRMQMDADSRQPLTIDSF